MTTPLIIDRAIKTVKTHAPEILTAFGVTGVVTTAYLTATGTAKAIRVIDQDERTGGVHADRKERIKNRVRLGWKFYVPAASSAGVTIGCIFGAQRVNARRTAAAVTAYAVAERAFSEYRDKVVEQIGKGPERKIRDAVAQDRVDKSPPSGVIVMGDGQVLCCEEYTGRYFQCNMEALNQAVNEINAKVNGERYVTLSQFYDLIGLEHTSVSSELGWEEKMMAVEFTTVLAPNNQPCLSFQYNYVKPL